MSKIIDLDVLLPQPVTIKFGEQEINISPPTVADTILLGHYTEKMREAQNSGENIEEAVTNVTNHLYKLIPQLEAKPINKLQLEKLVDIIADMNISEEQKALQAKGVTAATSKKVQ